MENEVDAYQYKEILNNYCLDKKHRLRVYTLREYSLACDMPDHMEFKPFQKPTLESV